MSYNRLGKSTSPFPSSPPTATFIFFIMLLLRVGRPHVVHPDSSRLSLSPRFLALPACLPACHHIPHSLPQAAGSFGAHSRSRCAPCARSVSVSCACAASLASCLAQGSTVVSGRSNPAAGTERVRFRGAGCSDLAPSPVRTALARGRSHPRVAASESIGHGRMTDQVPTV